MKPATTTNRSTWAVRGNWTPTKAVSRQNSEMCFDHLDHDRPKSGFLISHLTPDNRRPRPHTAPASAMVRGSTHFYEALHVHERMCEANRQRYEESVCCREIQLERRHSISNLEQMVADHKGETNKLRYKIELKKSVSMAGLPTTSKMYYTNLKQRHKVITETFPINLEKIEAIGKHKQVSEKPRFIDLSELEQSSWSDCKRELQKRGWFYQASLKDAGAAVTRANSFLRGRRASTASTLTLTKNNQKQFVSGLGEVVIATRVASVTKRRASVSIPPTTLQNRFSTTLQNKPTTNTQFKPKTTLQIKPQTTLQIKTKTQNNQGSAKDIEKLRKDIQSRLVHRRSTQALECIARGFEKGREQELETLIEDEEESEEENHVEQDDGEETVEENNTKGKSAKEQGTEEKPVQETEDEVDAIKGRKSPTKQKRRIKQKRRRESRSLFQRPQGYVSRGWRVLQMVYKELVLQRRIKQGGLGDTHVKSQMWVVFKKKITAMRRERDCRQRVDLYKRYGYGEEKPPEVNPMSVVKDLQTRRLEKLGIGKTVKPSLKGRALSMGAALKTEGSIDRKQTDDKNASTTDRSRFEKMKMRTQSQLTIRPRTRNVHDGGKKIFSDTGIKRETITHPKSSVENYNYSNQANTQILQSRQNLLLERNSFSANANSQMNNKRVSITSVLKKDQLGLKYKYVRRGTVKKQSEVEPLSVENLIKFRKAYETAPK